MEQMICERCGTIGWPEVRTPGSFVIEVILWIAFGFIGLFFSVCFFIGIVPALIYTVWRFTSKRCDVCCGCGAQALVPLASPRGRSLQETFKNS